jgi:hypothetical protein
VGNGAFKRDASKKTTIWNLMKQAIPSSLDRGSTALAKTCVPKSDFKIKLLLGFAQEY